MYVSYYKCHVVFQEIILGVGNKVLEHYCCTITTAIVIYPTSIIYIFVWMVNQRWRGHPIDLEHIHGPVVCRTIGYSMWGESVRASSRGRCTKHHYMVSKYTGGRRWERRPNTNRLRKLKKYVASSGFFVSFCAPAKAKKGAVLWASAVQYLVSSRYLIEIPTQKNMYSVKTPLYIPSYTSHENIMRHNGHIYLWLASVCAIHSNSLKNTYIHGTSHDISPRLLGTRYPNENITMEYPI